MARSLVILVAFAVAGLFQVSNGLDTTTTTTTLAPPMWPAPTRFTSGSSKIVVNTTLTLDVTCVFPASVRQLRCQEATDLLQEAVNRKINVNVLSQHTVHTSGEARNTVSLINFKIHTPVARPQLGMNESYTLRVVTSPSPAVFIDCNEVFGCYHGLETLSQLISFSFDTQDYTIHHAPWTVEDSPRFAHRGLLIDTSRHWLPLAYIRRVIDSMTYAKLNVVHWHLTDAEAFPFDSPSYPLLGQKGAWSSQERYSSLDVSSIVSFAEERGVRVMVEFDTPGHTAAMCKGAPEVCPDPLCPSSNLNNWALDISKNASYNVAYGVLTDLSALFFEDLLHLGGDEVIYYCWSLHPHIVNWLNDRNLDFAGGYEYWVKKMQTFTRDTLHRTAVGWEEIWNHFGTQLHNTTIIQQWLPNSVSLPLNVTSHGYRLIWSDASRWYLDNITNNWDVMYQAEPCTGLPDANCELIIGGEGCMWGETVDASDGLQTIWPRQAAIAERLWSPRTTQDLVSAETRLMSFRCLLNDRGIPAAPVLNANARSPPPNPGSCFLQ